MLLTLSLGAVGLLLGLGVLYQWRGERRDRRRCPPPGRLVPVNGHRLHLVVRGGDGPTVVLESGVGASSISWSGVVEDVARVARVCAYDRAGLGWSDAGSRRQCGRRSVAELRRALRRAGLDPPYVLVGHSFGAYPVRLFAALHPQEVSGLVLVDPLEPEDWDHAPPAQRRRLAGGVLCARVAAALALVGIVRAAVGRFVRGDRRLPRAVLRGFPPAATHVVEGLVTQIAKLPARDWPAVRTHWTRTRSFWMLAQYLAALPRYAAEVSLAETPSAAVAPARPRWSMPVVVLSAASAPAVVTRHRATAASSTRGRHVIVPGGHWLQLDVPTAVVDAIRTVIAST